MKVCNHCKALKPLDDFPARKLNKDGHCGKCFLCHRSLRRKRYLSNYSHENQKAKDRYQNNREHCNAVTGAYSKKNRVELARKALERYHNNPKENIRTRIMTRILDTLHTKKPKNRKWWDILGYNVDALRAHLQKGFRDGMSWENQGQWHIDHKIPVSAFNYNSMEDIDFKRCWALENLQPMWADLNLRKHAKLNKPFQPSLAISSR